MAKKLLLILLCLFIFVGCSNNESKDPKNDPNNKENVDPIDEHNDNNPEIIVDDGKWHWIALKYDENDEYCKEHFKGEYKKNHLYAINDKTDENVELYNSEIDYFYYGTLEEDRRIVFVSNNVLYSVNFDGTGLIDLYHSNKMTDDVLGIKGKYTYFVDDNIICRVDLTNKNLEQIKKQENICQINPFNDNFVEFQVLNEENELEYHILALNTKEEEIYYSIDEMNETVSRISKVFDWLYSCINNKKYVGTIIIFPEIAVNEYLMTIYNYLDENEGKLHNNELEVIQKLLDVYNCQFIDTEEWNWYAVKYDENNEYCKEHFKGEYKKNHLYAINDKTNETIELFDSEIDYLYFKISKRDRRVVFISNHVLYSVNFDGTELTELYHSDKMTEDVLGIKGKYTYFVDDNIICRIKLKSNNVEQIKRQEKVCGIYPFNDNSLEIKVLNDEYGVEYHILWLDTLEEEIYYSVGEMEASFNGRK